jgi:hypothetical protein
MPSISPVRTVTHIPGDVPIERIKKMTRPCHFSLFSTAPSADPFLVVEREGSAVGAACFYLYPEWQGRAEITRRNRSFSVSALPRSL